MNKIYLIAPLAALVVFAVIHRHFFSEFSMREAEATRAAITARETAERVRQASADTARDAALAAQERRRADAEEKKRHTEELRAARLADEQRRDAAIELEAKLRRQLAALQSEREAEEKALADEREKIRQLQLEKSSNERALAFAAATNIALLRLRDEIEAADAQRRLANTMVSGTANPPAGRR